MWLTRARSESCRHPCPFFHKIKVNDSKIEPWTDLPVCQNTQVWNHRFAFLDTRLHSLLNDRPAGSKLHALALQKACWRVHFKKHLVTPRIHLCNICCQAGTCQSCCDELPSRGALAVASTSSFPFSRMLASHTTKPYAQQMSWQGMTHPRTLRASVT